MNAGRVVVACAMATLVACGSGSATGRAVIPSGATMRVAAESLASAGLIRSATAFRAYAKFKKGDRTVRAGTYVLSKDLGWSGILVALQTGRGMVETITIPEGFTAAQVARTLTAKLRLPAESIDVAMRDTAWIRRLSVAAPTLEGYLFPDTYTLSRGATARDAIDLMAKRFEAVWLPVWTARLDSLGLTRHDAVTLASIVEREAKKPGERAVIAGVYLNRLRSGMLLQADPTVQYALGTHQRRLYTKDLAVKSDYNTYLHRGLPPGPIASPGRASLMAALYPATVAFKYFVAFPDGHHEFRVTQAEHEAVVRVSRKAWAVYYKDHPAEGGAPTGGTKVP